MKPEISEKLYNLIHSKTFSALNKEEKNWVLEWLSRDEYDLLRSSGKHWNLKFEQERKKILPSVNVKCSLERELKKHTTKADRYLWISYRIPAWQVVLLLALIVPFLFLKSEKKSPQTQTVVISKDTVFQVVENIKQITKVDTVVRFIKIAEIPVKATKDTIKTMLIENDYDESMLSFQQVKSTEPLFDERHDPSATLREDSNLTKFSSSVF